MPPKVFTTQFHVKNPMLYYIKFKAFFQQTATIFIHFSTISKQIRGIYKSSCNAPIF